MSSLFAKFVDAQNVHGTDCAAYAKAVSQEFSTEPDAFAHYLETGRSAAPELFPFIDPDYYFLQLDIEIPATLTAFEHYVREGARLDLSPTPLFDPLYVRTQSEPLQFESIFDYLGNAAFADVDPHPLFSKRYYRALYSDVAQAGLDPFLHFIRHGWQERRAISPFFGSQEYSRLGVPAGCDRTTFNRLMVAALASPDLSSMQAMFDAEHYKQSLASAEGIETPLQHFLVSGWRHRGSAFPLFDQEFYLAQGPNVRNEANPYIEYLSDFSHRFSPSKFLDAQLYLQSAAVEPDFKGSLLEHFVRFGAEVGVRPHRQIIVTHVCPSIHSGLGTVQTFATRSRRRVWLCGVTNDSLLTSCLRGVEDIEPSLADVQVARCNLHPHSGALGKDAQLMINVARKIARCNCLVVSDSLLDDDWVARLFRPCMFLVSHVRPWLTLLSCSELLIRYWHQQYGLKFATNYALPNDVPLKVAFVASVLLASIPNKLVLTMDPFGVALLRSCGPQILSTIPEVSLLVDDAVLGREDQQWLQEYIAVNYCHFASLIANGNNAWDLKTIQPARGGALAPRIVTFSEEVRL
jgi:hypothetical protein